MCTTWSVKKSWVKETAEAWLKAEPRNVPCGSIDQSFSDPFFYLCERPTTVCVRLGPSSKLNLMTAKGISSNELREMYQQFFESKDHTRIPSAPLVPENDPSVLFTTAGMHPLVPYLTGEPHPDGKRLTDVQKVLRTTDIDDVGDDTHATVFEMLGNWSLGDYFKKDAIAWSWEFLTSEEWLGLSPDKLAISVFAGDSNAPKDDESAKLWREVGVPETRIAYLDKKDNWWPAGGGITGPQGPDTEIFYWTGSAAPPKNFDPSDEKWVEIWNNVFMEFTGDAEGKLTKLKQKNVDTGMGLERTIVVLNGLSSIYEIDTFTSLMEMIDEATQKPDEHQRRILADHIKASTFLLGDDVPVVPDKREQGSVLRLLIRRAIDAASKLGVDDVLGVLQRGSDFIVDEYADVYASFRNGRDEAGTVLKKEVEKYNVALKRGFREVEKYRGQIMTGYIVHGISSTYAVPVDSIRDYADEHDMEVSRDFDDELEQAREKHREVSRAGAAGKFKGGLADNSEMSVKYHTTTHLLHQALREVLGDHVVQKGSNITAERLRFDFSHPVKLTEEERSSVEDLVNEKIGKDLPVKREEMTVAEAKGRGALGLFEDKYGDRVSVYSVGDWSVEICGGPHVETTGALGNFKIVKEESAGAGVRRVKAVLT